MGEIGMNRRGILYAVSYVLGAGGFTFLKKKHPWNNKKRVLCIFMAAFLILFMATTDGVPKLLFWPCLIVEFATLYALMYFANDMNRINTLYYTIHMFIIGEFSASLEWLLCFFVIRGAEAKPSVLQILYLIATYFIPSKLPRSEYFELKVNLIPGAFFFSVVVIFKYPSDVTDVETS